MDDEKLKIYNEEVKKIAKDFVDSINNYKKYIDKSFSDVTIDVLCLPNNINTILKENKIYTVYDLKNSELTKIDGIGSKKLGIINFRLSQFLGM